jgi:hypothetical protein
MPAWIHDRAKHIWAKNPGMDESTSFAIATQQAHSLGKTPKGYGTAQGKREAKAKYDAPTSEYKKMAEVGMSFFSEMHEIIKEAEDQIPGGKADDKTDSDFPKDQMEMGEKVELEHTGNPSLAREIARDHLEEFSDYYTRLREMENQAEKAKGAKVYPAVAKRYPGLSERSSVPPLSEKAKEAMIPTTPTMMGASKNPAMVSLARSQRVGTTDDPNGPKYKALNQMKPTPSKTVSSTPSSLKLSSAALGFFKKLAFNASSFSGDTLILRPQYASGVRPIGEGTGSASVMDPKLGGEGGIEKYKRALMPKEGADPGAPRTTAPLGPSIAQVSKPKGFGRPVSGALKNRI